MASHYFSVVVVVGGVDISALLRGAVEIEQEEGAAAIARFAWRPAPGALSPFSYVGASVTITHVERNAAGATISTALKFTGVIDVPEWSWEARELTVICTDNRQNRLQGLSNAAIDALTPGALFSEVVSGEGLGGMPYAEERLASLAASLDIDAGGTFRLTAWGAAISAHYTLTDTDCCEGSAPQVQSASRHDITNKVVCTPKFRFKRLWQRRTSFGWQMTHHDAATWGAYLADTYLRPVRQSVEAAIRGNGWLLVGDIAWTPPPPSGLYGGQSWGITEELRAQECVAFTCTMARNFGQDVEETQTLNVRAPASIAKLGESKSVDGFTLDTDFSERDWESKTVAEASAPAGFTAYGADAWYQNQDAQGTKNRALFGAAMQALVRRARIKVLASHRRNFVTVETMHVRPEIDLIHTVAIDTAALDAKGKVFRIVHRWVLGEGAHTASEITIALSRLEAAGVAETSYTPTAPSAGLPQDTPAAPGTMSTHIGGRTGAAPHDPAWLGWITMDETPDGGAPVYPVEFRCGAPAIDGDWRTMGAATHTEDIDVDIPEDPLSIVN